nr:MAG TPA: hypothetical protein [Caudoviricetes sp.]
MRVSLYSNIWQNFVHFEIVTAPTHAAYFFISCYNLNKQP